MRIRRNARALLVAPVTVEYTTDKVPQSTYTADISLDGLFIMAENPRPVGTKLRFELAIQRGARPIKGFGEVRWIRIRHGGQGRPAGMGVLIQMMVGEEGEQILSDVIAEALSAIGAGGDPVPAPALDLDSPEDQKALNRARKPEAVAEDPLGEPESARVVRRPPREFEFGMHAQRAAELRSQRQDSTGRTRVDQFMNRLGFRSRLYWVLLPLLIILLIMVIRMIF